MYTRLELAALVNLTPQATVFALSDLTPHCHTAVRNLGMILIGLKKTKKNKQTFFMSNCLRDGTEVNKITTSLLLKINMRVDTDTCSCFPNPLDLLFIYSLLLMAFFLYLHTP